MSNESLALIFLFSWCAYPYKAQTIHWLWSKLRPSSRPGESQSPPDYRPEYLKASERQALIGLRSKTAADYLKPSSSLPPEKPGGPSDFLEKLTESPADRRHFGLAGSPGVTSAHGTPMEQDLESLQRASSSSSGPSGGVIAESLLTPGPKQSLTSAAATPSTFTTEDGAAGPSSREWCRWCHLPDGDHFKDCIVYLERQRSRAEDLSS